MTIEAIQPLTGLTQNITTEAVNPAPSQTFEALFTDGVERINDSLKMADSVLQDMALNKPVSAHEVMLIMQEAKSELRMAVEVRNKLLEGYQEIMRMQV